jgi:hypothetical protein
MSGCESTGGRSESAGCALCNGLAIGMIAAGAVWAGGLPVLAAVVAAVVLVTGHVLRAGRWRAGLLGFGLAVAATIPAIGILVREGGRWAPACAPTMPSVAAALALAGLALAAAAAVPVPVTRARAADRLVRGGLVGGLMAIAVAAGAVLALGCFASSGGLGSPVDVTGSVEIGPILRPTLP